MQAPDDMRKKLTAGHSNEQALALSTFDDIFAELVRRCQQVVLIAVSEDVRDASQENIRTRWIGDPPTVLGLSTAFTEYVKTCVHLSLFGAPDIFTDGSQPDGPPRDPSDEGDSS